MANRILQIHPSSGVRRNSSFCPSWRNAKRDCLIFFILLLVVYAGFNGWVHFWIQKKIQEEASRGTIDPSSKGRNFLETYITFPKEWETPPVRSNVLGHDVSALRDLWKQFDKNDKYYASRTIQNWINAIFDPNASMTQEDWDEIKEFVLKYESYEKAGDDAVKKLATEILNVSPIDPLPVFIDETYNFHEWLRLKTLKAYAFAHDGEWNESIDVLLLQLPVCVQNPIHQFIAYSYKYDRLERFVANARLFVGNVWDEKKLQVWLGELNQWEPYLFRLKKEYAAWYQIYARLLEKKIPIDFEKERKVKYYVDKIKNAEFPSSGMKKAFGLFSKNIFAVLSGIKTKGYVHQPVEIEMVRPFVLTGAVEEYYTLRTYAYDSSAYFKCEQEIANRYDELRLAVAAKLFVLRNKKSPQTPTELVPDYFDREIVNRLTGNPYRWNERGVLMKVER